jgi:predicted SAM-dependent methyltransferase
MKSLIKFLISKSRIQKFYKRYKQKYDFLLYRNHINRKQKLNVGSGKTEFDQSWFSCDKDILDITKKNSWSRLLGNIRLNNIFSEHVWEHLTEEETIAANENCYYFLKRNGKLRIAVPDGFHPSKEYLEHVKPNGTGIGSEDHKILYNYQTLSTKLKEVGFDINLIEYWDEEGHFHSKSWDIKDGKVMRSKQFDKRNKYGQLKYTSLIVDAVKR